MFGGYTINHFINRPTLHVSLYIRPRSEPQLAYQFTSFEYCADSDSHRHTYRDTQWHKQRKSIACCGMLIMKCHWMAWGAACLGQLS